MRKPCGQTLTKRPQATAHVQQKNSSQIVMLSWSELELCSHTGSKSMGNTCALRQHNNKVGCPA